MKLIDTRDAVGHVLCHDMTQIIVGVTKDARFRKGHVVTEEDIPVLLSMGKEKLYVWERPRAWSTRTRRPNACAPCVRASTCTPRPSRRARSSSLLTVTDCFRLT